MGELRSADYQRKEVGGYGINAYRALIYFVFFADLPVAVDPLLAAPFPVAGVAAGAFPFSCTIFMSLLRNEKKIQSTWMQSVWVIETMQPE